MKTDLQGQAQMDTESQKTETMRLKRWCSSYDLSLDLQYNCKVMVGAGHSLAMFQVRYRLTFYTQTLEHAN